MGGCCFLTQRGQTWTPNPRTGVHGLLQRSVLYGGLTESVLRAQRAEPADWPAGAHCRRGADRLEVGAAGFTRTGLGLWALELAPIMPELQAHWPGQRGRVRVFHLGARVPSCPEASATFQAQLSD